MPTSTNLMSKAEGAPGAPSRALDQVSAGTETARQRTFPASLFFTPAGFAAGASTSTDRADAGPTDKG
jgi:hypothetical protein